VKRTSYSEWKVALQSIQEPPKQKFTTNRTAIIKGVESTLNWEVENAYSIELITFDMQSGLETFRQALTDKGSLSIRPSKDTKYRLLSTGYFGQTPPNDIDIQVFPTPILERLVVPIPDFNRRVNLNPSQIGAPNINVSLKHNFITDTPNFTKPSFDLLTIRATHKPKRTTLYLSGLFERITKQISGKKMKQKNKQQSLSDEEDLELRKPSWLQNFFIMCSGADKDLMSQCPSEFNKYSGIGATIFFDRLACSFYRRLRLEFCVENVPLSILFGILWGIIIFNLDRYIVLSLRKEKIPTKTDILKAPSQQEKDELTSDRSRMLWESGTHGFAKIFNCTCNCNYNF
jgi:hypothetical protein